MLLPPESTAVIVMKLYPPSRVTLAEKFPEESASTTCSPEGATTATEASAAVLPEMVKLLVVLSESSAGEVILSSMPDCDPAWNSILPPLRKIRLIPQV